MTDTIADPPDRRRRMHLVREIALTIAALGGVLCAIAMIAAIFFGITPLAFRSGSMEPTIPTGSLAFAQHVAAAEIEAGDIVSVNNQRGVRITHRVVSVDSSSAEAIAMTLRGDANGVPDSESYVVTSADRVLFHVSGLGYLVAWFSTLAAKILCGLVVAVLLWIILFPTGRRRSSSAAQPSGPETAGPTNGVMSAVILVLATAIAIGAGHVQGTGAAYVDAATARTGQFAAKADFVPRINTLVFGLSYVTCATSGVSPARVVTLTWSHIGPPYRYRMLLRDGEGNIWRTVDVVPPVSAAPGTQVSATFGASGFPARSTQWEYVAEIHTMLAGGQVSTAWRGYRVYQDWIVSSNLSCRLTETESATTSYIPPPASISCVTNADKTATISWPHRASYTYRMTLRDRGNNNVAFFQNVVPTIGTPDGQMVSAVVRYSDLKADVLSGAGVTAEVRTRVSDTIQSGEYVSYNLTANSTNGVSCVTALAGARLAPSSTSTAGPTSSSAVTTPPGTTSTTAPSDTQSTEPTTPTTSPATTTTPDTVVEQPLSPSTQSTSGTYSAQLVQAESGSVVVIRNASDEEEFRVATSPDGVIEWVDGTDDVRITDSTGIRLVSRTSGVWVISPYTQAVSAAPTTADSPVASAPIPTEDSPSVTELAPTDN